MTNTKTTKRALLASILSLVICLSMLASTTFAWFTDSASTAVNTIQSGKLDVTLEMLVDGKWVDAEGKTLGFVDDEGNVLTDILWEPGCSYLLQPFRITNNGNLALKFDIIVSGLSGDLKLAEVIEYGLMLGSVDNLGFVPMGDLNSFDGLFDGIKDSVLKPGESTDTTENGVTLHMKEDAGNEYQGLTLSGMAITVVATQATVEFDSYTDQYDKDAEYPVVMAGTGAQLSGALTQNEDTKVILNGDVTLEDVTKIVGNKSIDLNGHKLTVVEDRAIDIDNGSSVILANGTVEYAGEDAPIIVRDNSELVIDGAVLNVTNTITGSTYGNAAGIIVNQGSGSVVTMNSGEINVKGSNGGSGVYVAYAKGGNHTFNFNGGTINVETGKYGVGIECLSTNTLNLNGGVINMKDASEGWAFNVGQSQGQPTVVTGNGKTVVNLYGDANVAYENDDAPQFEGVAFTCVKANVLEGTTEEVNDKLNEVITNTNEPTLVELPKGEYTLPTLTNKDVTIVGDKDTVIDTTAGMPGTNGADVTFEGVTINFKEGGSYGTNGFTHSKKIVYKDCVINGTQFLYASEGTEFINCTFNVSGDNYAVWTYGTNATFTGCTFNCDGKAVLVYTEGAVTAEVVFNDCIFNDNGTISGKAAIEVGESAYGNKADYTIKINNCTANGFDVTGQNASTFGGTDLGTNVWGNKNLMPADRLDVIVDGTEVY